MSLALVDAAVIVIPDTPQLGGLKHHQPWVSLSIFKALFDILLITIWPLLGFANPPAIWNRTARIYCAISWSNVMNTGADLVMCQW